MPRLISVLLIALLPLLAGLSGCKKAPGMVDSQAKLILQLPGSIGALAPVLKVDGQEVAVPANKAPLLVTPPEGKGGVTLTYEFWPDAYSKIVRTKVVKLSRGEAADVNFLDEDAATPDRVYVTHQATPPNVVEAMCQLAKVGGDDVIYDVGCGDGQVILAAVQKGGAKRGVGLEYDEDRARTATENVKKAGASERVKIVEEDVLDRKDFSRPTVIILSWTTPVNEQIRSLLQTTLRHGTRIVSCRSDLGDWKPDETRMVKAKDAEGREVEYKLRLWTVRHPKAPNLELALPPSDDPPEYAPERVSKLLIDGKDHTTPRVCYRSLNVEPPPGQDSVKVVYTFWPNTYTAITRTRTVKLEKGKLTRASLMEKDPAGPDDIIRPIYVPTPEEVVDKMCQMGKIGPNDVVYDVGCGDGRLVIQGVKKFKAKKGVGIDINPQLVKLCQKNAQEAGVADRVTFEAKDAQTIKDFSEASVVFLYLGDHLNLALRPALQKTLKPGSRIISHRFTMGDWKPDQTVEIKAKDNDGETDTFFIHVWTIK